MADPFTSFFKLIISIFEMIGMLFMMLIDLQNTLMCPFKIWNNIGKCLGYWVMDVIINIIYFIIFWILFFFLYIPIWIGSFLLCLFLRNTSDSFCFDVSYEDIIPSKDSVCFPIEFIYNKLTGGRLIYRNGEDISNCYCVPPLILAFSPYKTYSDISSSSSEDSNSGSMLYFLIAVSLLGTVYLTNLKSKK
jgi:hypothetical protein